MFLLLCRDEAEVFVSTNIDDYTIQPEGSEESFKILLEAFKQDVPY